TTRKAQRANTGSPDLIDQTDGTVCADFILPRRLPIVAANAFCLAIFGQFDVSRERSNRRRQKLGRHFAANPNARQIGKRRKHYKVSREKIQRKIISYVTSSCWG